MSARPPAVTRGRSALFPPERPSLSHQGAPRFQSTYALTDMTALTSWPIFVLARFARCPPRGHQRPFAVPCPQDSLGNICRWHALGAPAPTTIEKKKKNTIYPKRRRSTSSANALCMPSPTCHPRRWANKGRAIRFYLIGEENRGSSVLMFPYDEPAGLAVVFEVVASPTSALSSRPLAFRAGSRPARARARPARRMRRPDMGPIPIIVPCIPGRSSGCDADARPAHCAGRRANESCYGRQPAPWRSMFSALGRLTRKGAAPIIAASLARGLLTALFCKKHAPPTSAM